MKNTEKIAAAQSLLTHAKALGFEDAYITYSDEEGSLFESIEDLANDRFAGETTATVYLVLDEELGFVIEEEEDSDDPPKITFVS